MAIVRGPIMYYEKVLTDSEIYQVYNSSKTRYI